MINKAQSSFHLMQRHSFLICNVFLIHRYVICDSEGTVLRRQPSMAQAQAEKYAQVSAYVLCILSNNVQLCFVYSSLIMNITQSMKSLSFRARSLARDLNPKDELRNLRIRTKKKEVIVSHDKDFIVIVIQQWTPYVP